MKLLLIYVLLFLMFFFLSGCFGTLLTRIDGYPVGAPPYGAVYLDGCLAYMALDSGGSTDKFFAPIFILCCPFDFVIDTALLPIDLVTWPMGLKKECSIIWP